jgi:hypothetical protein
MAGGMLILIAAVIGGFLLVAYVLESNAAFETRCLRTALRLRGRFEPGGWFSNGAIHFDVADRPARLQYKRGRGAGTWMHVTLPEEAPGTVRVTPVQLGWELLRLVGYDSVKIGDPVFDASFAVTGSPALIRQMFGPETRSRAMEAVRRLAPYPGFDLQVRARSLRVHFDGTLEEDASVLAMRLAAEELISLLFGPPAGLGIEWGESVERAAGLCPICTTPLAEPILRCPRCRAPHHRECWEYLGHCAVYGCEPKPGQRAA